MLRSPLLRLPLAAPLVVALLLATAGCRTPTTPEPAVEASVRPGVNSEYLKPDIEVSQWVERFEREGREIYDRREEIARAVRIRPGTTVADIGAGTGLFTPMFARAVGSSGKVYAVDLVPAFLRLIEKRAADGGLAQVQTVLCTERSVELPAGSVDVAFICDAYHHFEFPRSTMTSLQRALRRDGELLLVEFKRIPGESSQWVLDHVRAGQEVVTAEIEAAGFRKIEELPILKDNYVIRFRKR